jgi:hypothetical protein
VGRTAGKLVVENYIKCRVKAVGGTLSNALLNFVLIVECRRWEGLLSSALLNIILNVD